MTCLGQLLNQPIVGAVPRTERSSLAVGAVAGAAAAPDGSTAAEEETHLFQPLKGRSENQDRKAGQVAGVVELTDGIKHGLRLPDAWSVGIGSWPAPLFLEDGFGQSPQFGADIAD